MTRQLGTVLCALVLAVVFWLLVDARTAGSDVSPTVDLPPFPPFASGFFHDALVRGAEVEQLRARLRFERRRVRAEHRRYLLARRRVSGLKRTLMASPDVSTAIDLACTVYGSCSTLRRRAWCESRLDSGARNPSGASGLFQFLSSTWRSTPFGGFSIFDPYANALAAGWMEARGRGAEWVCR